MPPADRVKEKMSTSTSTISTTAPVNTSSTAASTEYPVQEKKSIKKNVNYISIGMKRFKELSLPVLSLLNSLNPSQRRIALIAVGIIFFWPLLILALNLPWMLAASCGVYVYFFGKGKFYADANEAVKDHLEVDVEEKGREVQKKFKESQFPGKETLIYGAQRALELTLVAYKSLLLASMTVLDYLVTLLLNAAKTAKNLANKN